jgi:hypothetical protein
MKEQIEYIETMEQKKEQSYGKKQMESKHGIKI